jgi:hypothetical protein
MEAAVPLAAAEVEVAQAAEVEVVEAQESSDKAPTALAEALE